MTSYSTTPSASSAATWSTGSLFAENEGGTIHEMCIMQEAYEKPEFGFDGHSCGVIVALDEQSADIAMGVDKALEAKKGEMKEDEIEAIGAGDQGMMFGFATNETDSLMPYPIDLARKLTNKLTQLRETGEIPYLRPDGKAQVSVNYDKDGNVVNEIHK